MARELRIDAVVETSASADAVWSLLADIDTWKTWGRWSVSELERPGEPDPAGVGAIRRFRLGRSATREEVVAFEPAARLGYELRSGLPIRNYRAEVTLVPTGSGSRLEWHCRFDPTPRGRILRPTLSWFVRDTAKRLVRAAEAA